MGPHDPTSPLNKSGDDTDRSRPSLEHHRSAAEEVTDPGAVASAAASASPIGMTAIGKKSLRNTKMKMCLPVW